MAVDLAGEVDTVAARKRSDKDFVPVVEISVASVQVRQLRAVGREQTGAFKLLVAGKLADLAGLDVQNLQSAQIAVPN